jgi:hypothetical protein
MAEINSTDKTELTKIWNQLQSIAGTLAGIEPLVSVLNDAAKIDCRAANILYLVGSMADRLNNEVCDIADKLHDIGQTERAIV